MKNKAFFPHFTALIAMLIWGGSYVWSSQVFRILHPATTILLRLIISSIFLFSCIFILHRNEKIKKQDIGLFCLSAVFEPFLYFIGESYGLVRVEPTICSAIIATIPLFAPFAAFIFLKEKIGKWNIVGFVISFCGVILMLFNNQFQFTASATGLMFLFGAVVVAVCYSITLKKLTYRYSALTIVAVQNTIGIFYFLPFVLLTESTYLPDILLVRQYILPLLLLGILASSVAYVLYTFSVEKIGVARSNVYTNIIPIFTVGFSYILIHEQITAFKITGTLVVIFGLILSQVKPKKQIRS